MKTIVLKVSAAVTDVVRAFWKMVWIAVLAGVVTCSVICFAIAALDVTGILPYLLEGWVMPG